MINWNSYYTIVVISNQSALDNFALRHVALAVAKAEQHDSTCSSSFSDNISHKQIQLLVQMGWLWGLQLSLNHRFPG